MPYTARKPPPGSCIRVASNLPLLVCLGSALVPFTCVQITYLLSSSAGFVDWCFPYTDSCTSISATGRHAPASFVFRGMMLPSAALMMVFWWLHWRCLASLGSHEVQRHGMLALGTLACLGLIIYVSVLGEVGDLWRLQRRIGTVLFFSFTFLAQLLLASLLRETATSPIAQTVGARLLRLCQVMLLIGIFSVVVQLLSEDWHDSIEDAIEWQLALLLQLNFLLCSRLWIRGHWQIDVQAMCAASGRNE